MHAKIAALVAVLGITLLLPAVPARAGSPYLSARVGYTVPMDENAGVLGGLDLENYGSLGASYGQETDRGYAQFRLEGELTYRQNELDDAELFGDRLDLDGHVLATALMVNVYCVLKTMHFVRPYGMIGAGGAWVIFDDAEAAGIRVVDDSQFQYAYQLGGGLALPLTDQTSIDLGYRYFSTSRDEFEDEVGEDFWYRYRIHEFAVGLQYRF